VVFVVYQQLESHYSPTISSLGFFLHFEVQPLIPASHPFVSTCDTSFAHATGRIFNLIWQEILKAAKSTLGSLEGY